MRALGLSISLTVIGILVIPELATAATCADRVPAPIAAVPSGSLKCQEAIAKGGAAFLRAKVKTLAKCLLKEPAGTCPTGTDVTKIEKAALGAAEDIAEACGDDAAQAGLTSSYADGTDPGVISSCMLSQHNVVAELVVAQAHGATTEPWPDTGKERSGCVKDLSKQSTKFLDKALKTATKCFSAQAKAGTAGDLAPICLGSFAGGVFVPPTDAKAADKQAKLVQKTEDSLTKKCGPAEPLGQIASLFACPGAATVADLQTCIVCAGWNALFDVAEQQYSEQGEFVAHGPGAIQAAVAAAAAGDKLLIASGDYQEEVLVSTDDLALVGCGGATNDRPRIVPPTPEVAGRGFRAAGIDGLLFQSLDFFNQTNDHIRIAQADGVTFRDITGDGNRNTAYAVFPVESNDVLVELCKVRGQDDAPIYVGQSSTIVVRFNEIRSGVAGIEIENSGNAQVFGNYAAGNTAGLLVFKDGSLPVQLAQCHAVHHNLFENNNEPNFGSGTVAGVPTGTGILVISSDTTPYSYNLVRGNNTTGLTLTDQVIADFGPPFSADQSVDGNYVFDNVLQGNGNSPDPDRWPLPLGADLVFLATESSGNCESGNTFTSEIGFAAFAGGSNAGTCTLPPPAVLPTCPAPPIPIP